MVIVLDIGVEQRPKGNESHTKRSSKRYTTTLEAEEGASLIDNAIVLSHEPANTMTFFGRLCGI